MLPVDRRSVAARLVTFADSISSSSSSIVMMMCYLAFPQVHGMCRCQASFAGADCSIDIGANPHVELLVDKSRLGKEVPAPTGRVGHTMVSCGDHKLYVFGGYNLEQGLLSDMWRYDTLSGEWELLEPRVHRPRGRSVLLGLEACSVDLSLPLPPHVWRARTDCETRLKPIIFILVY